MINLKKVLKEQKQNEFGCLMAMIPEKYNQKINNFNKKIILDEELYIEGDEFGREKEGHVTIRYGFLPDLNELQIRQLLKGQKSFVVEVKGISLFEQEKEPYDVVKFDIQSPTLIKLNEKAKQYSGINTYPIYHPHLTLAYVQKGKGKGIITENINFQIPIYTACYSPISGEKSYYQLL
jgi:2'-5' RNA ligase